MHTARVLKRLVGIACAIGALAVAAPGWGAFGFLGITGTTGSGDGQFSDPRGVHFARSSGNYIYVADTGNARIQKLSNDGLFLLKWGTPGSGDGQFDNVLGVAVGLSGQVFTLEGAPNNRVQHFDDTGQFVSKFGGTGSGDGQFSDPRGIAVFSMGDLFVADRGNGRIEKFDSGGVFQLEWGSPGTGPGQFDDLVGIAIQPAGQFIYTLENAPRRVQKFDLNGNFAAEFSVSDPDHAYPLSGIGVDENNFIYVVGAGADPVAIRRFAPDGTLTETVFCHNTAMYGVAGDNLGRIWVAGTRGSDAGLLRFGADGGSCDPAPPGGGGGGGGAGGSGLAFAGNEGVSINGGDQFTANPAVVLTVVAPGGATGVRISNDGGFAGAASVPVALDGHYPWQLAFDATREENQRIPKTVYVRFSGPGGDSALTFTDDIILDTVPPAIASASLSGSGTTTGAVAAAGRKRFTLRVRATDNASGVGTMQLATRKHRPGKLRSYTRKLTLRAAKAPRYVRVRDRAGNFSRWRKIKR